MDTSPSPPKSPTLKSRRRNMLISKGGSLNTDIKQIYKFGEILGGGKFGTVRIGSKLDNPHKKYAIKSISKKGMSQTDLSNLLTEVQILSNLDHPNIIKLIETYQDQYYLHIVTDLCSGKDVFNHCLHKQNLTERDVCLIIFKILSAIQYLHDNKIVHRDIKAENIILESTEPDAEVKIIDFGLSKKYNSKQKLTTKTGTPFYVSPEVINGEYNEKCDIWSIGIVAYLLLTGTLPFTPSQNGRNAPEDEQELYNKILNAKPSFAQKIWKNYSRKAADFVNKCLIKNPQKRFEAKIALEHPWFRDVIQDRQNPEMLCSETLENLRHFSNGVYLKQMVLKFLINTLSYKELKSLQNEFAAIDLNNNGNISKNELEFAFKTANVDITNEELDKIFQEHEGGIGYSDFIASSLNHKKFIDKQKLAEAFKYFDVDNNGYIDLKDINNYLLRSGKQLKCNEDVKMIIDEVINDSNGDDNNKDGVSFNEFLALFDVDINNG